MTTEFRIEIEGLEERIARLNGNLAAVVKAADRAVGVGAEIVLGEARLNVTGRSLNVRTGRLRGSLSRAHEKGSLEARVGTNVVYARIHEYGGTTKPHIIRAVNAKALGPFLRKGGSFFGPMRTSEFVFRRKDITRTGAFTRRFVRSARGRSILGFAKSVQHPGSVIPARPYMRPALETSVPRIKQTFTGLVEEALAKAGA